MSNDQSIFSFDLNESLFFEKGQEVEEMRGISLDPEISIQAFNEYISIRGVIELRGEYQKVASIEEEDEILDFEDIHTKRFVEKVTDTSESLAEFSHRFPVEISVPTYRVTDLNDVTVNIESFDYELPEQSQLKLVSTIEIHGINNEFEQPRDEETHENTEDAFEMEREAEDTFQFEFKEKQEEATADDVSEGIDPENTPILSEEVDTIDPERWKIKSQSLSDYFNDLSSKEMEEELVEPEPIEETPPEMDIEETYELDNLDESDVDRSDSVQDVGYLSDMFRNSEEDQYVKMRLCIVQEQDTIETIADRFKISPLQLIKQNQLEEDFDVTEGQLLYIPSKK